MSNLFTLELLQAVSDWQRGGSDQQNRKRGQQLKEASVSLPERYRTCSLCCFRQIALPKGGVWELIAEDRLSEKISSWTMDLEVAKKFKGGVPPKGQEYQGVILCTFPQPSSVVVNLQALYRDPDFTEALEREKHNISGYHAGAGRYGFTQSEVVLEVATVTQENVYSLGGHSSSFQRLLDEAELQVYGSSATLDQRQALVLKAEHVHAKTGPNWLTPDATQRVLGRMPPHVELLQKAKDR